LELQAILLIVSSLQIYTALFHSLHFESYHSLIILDVIKCFSSMLIFISLFSKKEVKRFFTSTDSNILEHE
jgi:hypothetical protein